MRKASIICSILLSLFFLTEPVNAQSINLTPKWTAQAQFAGYYVADKLGFYKEEGLDVHVVHPSLSASSFSFLQKGYSQAVVMNLSYALTEYFAGAQVVNILQTSQENSLMLVSRSPLKGISSLQHKKIGVWNHLSQELLDQIANKYQLQVSREFYQKYPQAVQKLARASIRGWEWANEHREQTLDIIMEQVHQHNIGTNRYHQRKMLDEILRLQTNKKSGQRPYRLSREVFDLATSILLPDQIKNTSDIRYENFVK